MILCLCTTSCLAEEPEVTELLTSPTQPPTPQTFNIIDCYRSFDSPDQRNYICLEHEELFAILRYAERIGTTTCEENFQHEHWNCSGFSLLRQPNVTKGGMYTGWVQVA
jgi:hypothetical protein